MSLWFLQGLSSSSSSTSETNYPSLWSGGVTWEAADAGTGTQAYWQTSAAPTARIGKPDISIAVAGVPVTNTIRSASWQLGRGEWLSVLTPGAASFEIEGAVTFGPMDEVVIGVMSDTTDEHSDALWVGYVDTPSETTETSGRVTTSVSCVDLVGRFGQAPAPDDGIPASMVPTLSDWLEYIAADSGAYTEAVDDSGFAFRVITFAFEDGETALSAINRLERQENANVFVRGDGRFVIQRRYYDFEPDRDPAPTPVALSSADAPATWTTELPPTSVVNDWGDLFATTSTQRASRLRYGRRPATAEDTAGWDALISTDLLLEPRLQLSSADLPVTDLGDAILFLDPNDWVTLDGETYQVLSVQHSVEPGHRWRVSIAGDTTQVALHEAFA